MKAVVQRVKRTTLSVNGELISEIPFGLTVFLGVKVGDSEKEASYLAKKIAGLRIFEDENGKMNLSVKDVGGEVLLVSQFTLYGDASHGNRPSFTLAERPEKAEPLYEYAVKVYTPLHRTLPWHPSWATLDCVFTAQRLLTGVSGRAA